MGSKAVFGVLLIGVGILAAYLAITGQLQAVWTQISTGQSPKTATPTPTNTTSTSIPTTQAVTNIPSTIQAQAQAPYLPSTTAAQIQDALSTIHALDNYQPLNTLPSSAITYLQAPVSTLPSVYSTTLASQSGVTGVLS